MNIVEFYNMCYYFVTPLPNFPGFATASVEANMEAETDLDPQLHKSKKKKKKNDLKVTIEVQNEQPCKLAPLVGYFPSGYDPNSDESPQVKVYRHQKKVKRLELVVRPSGSKVDFVGTNYSGEAAAGRMCSYALGILDKETQKLKIVPIAANKVFSSLPFSLMVRSFSVLYAPIWCIHMRM